MAKEQSKEQSWCRKPQEGRTRVVVERVRPQIDGGEVPIRRVVGDHVSVTANCFSDGHDVVVAFVRYRHIQDEQWQEVRMAALGNDHWEGSFAVDRQGTYVYTVEAWVDPYLTWKQDFLKKRDAGCDLSMDVRIGISIMTQALERVDIHVRSKLQDIMHAIEKESDSRKQVAFLLDETLHQWMLDFADRRFASHYANVLHVHVACPKAAFSTWYELFPRSTSPDPGRHGTFQDCKRLLSEIAAMGFDVIYLPPIHPIGRIKRKGRNNAVKAQKDDPGSPWAIGAEEGGHQSVHPELGTLKDFRSFLKDAKEHNIDVALDIAFQCSPDHPYVKEHPEWFRWRPDGTVQYAENPPKKYEDVIPFDFECENWASLWDELKNVMLFWVKQGVSIFRVDNPHTKPFAFWKWAIADIHKEHPDIIFLAEAFTRPSIMSYLAKIGFTQSYTYFTWRESKQEFIDYMTELTRSDIREYMRPNFWPNTPDILPKHLQGAPRAAFAMRLVLAATLASNYGIYGAPYELCLGVPFPGKEEYVDNEKYEIKHWQLGGEGTLRPLITKINHIRHQYRAFQRTENIRFHESDNTQLLCFSKIHWQENEFFLIIVNLGVMQTQSGWVKVPCADFLLSPAQSYQVVDVLNDCRYQWNKEWNYVELDPARCPAHIFRIKEPAHDK